MGRKIRIVQEEQRVPVEIIAGAVVAMKRSAERLLAAGLTRDALAILIHHNMPIRTRVSQRDILAVLDAAASLDNFIMEPAPVESP
jgi:hypothetical protein